MRILYVMDYMRKNSDEDHPAKLSNVQKAITDRGIYTTRKALYDDFEILSDYGFEIIRRRNLHVLLKPSKNKVPPSSSE